MPRVISFIVLLVIVLLVGAIFFQVMAQFFVPLFLACVLLVVFQPLHAWTLTRLPRHPRISAFFTTVLILLAVLLPLVWLGWNAYVELHTLYRPGPQAAAAVEPAPLPADGAALPEPEGGLIDRLHKIAFDLRDKFAGVTTIWVQDDTVRRFISSVQTVVGAKVISGVQSVIGVLVGLAIMVISLYYFLADGPAMIRTVMYLSPLDARYETELVERFGEVSRAVVVATLLSAVVQGALAGIGYYFALADTAPIFLLTALTMVTAMVPFVGAAAVWVCVCGWVYLYGERIVDGTVTQGDPTTAIVLAIYCTIVVSGIDNVIKPFILHGQSRLHPLLALLSILGGVQVLGPVGILVGPMLVSFLQALLTMLRKELDSFSAEEIDAAKQLAVGAGVPEELTADKKAPAESGGSASADGNTAKSAKSSPPAAKPAAARRSKRKPGR